MSNVSGAQAQPVALSTNKARGGVTGHHVRYVLGFGLAGRACSLASALTDTGPLFSPRHPCQNGYEVAGYERGA
jgi:hypothetical protein